MSFGESVFCRKRAKDDPQVGLKAYSTQEPSQEDSREHEKACHQSEAYLP
jgi:hypothetical protein